LGAEFGAQPAPWKRDADVIAEREFGPAVADGLHHTRAFVAVNRGIGRVVVAVATVQVGLAHAARHDPDQRLVRPRIGQFEPIDREGTKFFAHDGSGDFHDRDPWLAGGERQVTNSASGVQRELSLTDYRASPYHRLCGPLAIMPGRMIMPLTLRRRPRETAHISV